MVAYIGYYERVPDRGSGRVRVVMARRSLANKAEENEGMTETYAEEIPQEANETPAETPAGGALPGGFKASKLNFVELSDDEVTVEKPRQRANSEKAEFIDAVQSVANAFENGQIYRPSVPLPGDKKQSDKLKYRYQNWIREANSDLGKRALICKSEVLNRQGERFLRFVVTNMTDEEKREFAEHVANK